MVSYYDLVEPDCIEFRCPAAGREIAACLCRMWTDESLCRISERFGLSYLDGSSNLIRRAEKRLDESKEYCQGDRFLDRRFRGFYGVPTCLAIARNASMASYSIRTPSSL